MNTSFLLLAQYGKAIVPVKDVVRDYFHGLNVENFMRKVNSGEIAIPVVRMYEGHKAPKGVAVADLAAYLDKNIEAARRECEALTG